MSDRPCQASRWTNHQYQTSLTQPYVQICSAQSQLLVLQHELGTFSISAIPSCLIVVSPFPYLSPFFTKHTHTKSTKYGDTYRFGNNVCLINGWCATPHLDHHLAHVKRACATTCDLKCNLPLPSQPLNTMSQVQPTLQPLHPSGKQIRCLLFTLFGCSSGPMYTCIYCRLPVPHRDSLPFRPRLSHV